MNHLNANHLITVAVCVLVSWGLVNVAAPPGKSARPPDDHQQSAIPALASDRVQPHPRRYADAFAVIVTVAVIVWLIFGHGLAKLLNNGSRW